MNTSLRDDLCTLATRAALLTRPQAAQALGISLRSLDAMLATGDLPAVRIGASVRIRPSSLDYFCEARESRNKPCRVRRAQAKP